MKSILIFLLFSLPLIAQSEFQKGQKFFVSNNYSQAKILFESVVAQDPKNLQALEYLGDIHGFASEWDNALSYYSKLKVLAPNNANYYYKYGGVLGMIAKNSNKFKALSLIGEVRASFEKAIALNSQHIDARWALIELYLQLPAIVGGSESKANKYANQLLQISPVDGFLAKGHIAEYFNRYAAAEINYKKAINVGQSKVTYEKLANLYRNKMNQPKKAATVLADYKKKSTTNNS